MNDISIEEALRDLAIIRRMVEEHRPRDDAGATARKAASLVQAGAFFAGFVFLAVEVLSGGALTETLLLSRSDRSMLAAGLCFVALSLILMVSILHLLLRSSATSIGTNLHQFLADNERHFHNLSISTDLIVKFLTFCFVVLAPRPEWIGPLLLIFTGDYLLQGRLFRLPFRMSLVLGLLCVCAGVLQFLAGPESLLPALTVYCVISGLSFARSLRVEPANPD